LKALVASVLALVGDTAVEHAGEVLLEKVVRFFAAISNMLDADWACPEHKLGTLFGMNRDALKRDELDEYKGLFNK